MPPLAKNIFVISSGRTGTTTFTKAARHLPGFTAAHESLASANFSGRLKYPEMHIEADNRLVFFLPQLEEKYGDDAYYVFIHRETGLIARSYARRWHLTVSVVRAWTHGVRMIPRVREDEIEDHCRDFVTWVDDTLRLFFSRQANVFHFNIDRAEEEFSRFAEWIGTSAPTEALAEWRISYNTNPQRGFRQFIRRRLRLIMP